MLTKYDPDRAPDPARWLAEDQSQLMDIIERYHRRERVELPKPRLHATIHLIVENQIAMGDELTVAATVQRLVRDGLSRHEAIHAVAWVLMRYLTETMRTKTEMDQEAYNQEIRELTEEHWRADFEDAEEDGA
jgi:hypothetical protein